MTRSRVIPVLLLSEAGVVKTTRFGAPVYIGDATNAVRIFSDKEADEIVILDIEASRLGREPDFLRIEQLATEAFMPLGYGGGITSLQQMERLFKIGVEKVILNSAIHGCPELLRDASRTFGSQSVVASIDVKKDLFGRPRVYSRSGTRREAMDLSSMLSCVQDQGAGEVILGSIDRDGTMKGYDLETISSAARQLDVPLVALGGAGSIDDLDAAIRAGASAVAAGSMFVFHGRHRAVLISYLDPSDFDRISRAPARI
jgi:cyclase